MSNCTYYRRPNDDRGGGGGGQSQKNIFEPLGPPFGLKIRAGGWGQAPGPLPKILHCCPNDMHFCLGN